MASEIKRIQETYGPLSVLCAETGAHCESKTVHADGGNHGLLFQSIFGKENSGYTYLWRNADSWEGGIGAHTMFGELEIRG
jgi:hypothetical protein